MPRKLGDGDRHVHLQDPSHLGAHTLRQIFFNRIPAHQGFGASGLGVWKTHPEPAGPEFQPSLAPRSPGQAELRQP